MFGIAFPSLAIRLTQRVFSEKMVVGWSVRKDWKMISLREYILLEKPWLVMAVSVFARFPHNFLKVSPKMTNFFYWFQTFFFFFKAAVLGTETLKNYLINYARSFIYTTFMGFSSLASIHCAYQMLEQGVTREVSVMLVMVGGDMRFLILFSLAACDLGFCLSVLLIVFSQAQQNVMALVSHFRSTIHLPHGHLLPSNSPIQGIVLDGKLRE